VAATIDVAAPLSCHVSRSAGQEQPICFVHWEILLVFGTPSESIWGSTKDMRHEVNPCCNHVLDLQKQVDLIGGLFLLRTVQRRYAGTAPAIVSKTVDTYVRAQCSNLPQKPINAAPCSGGKRKKRRYPQGKSHSSARSSPLQQLFCACFPLFSLQALNVALAKCCPPIKPLFATVKQLVQSFRYQKRQLNFAMDVQPFTDP
jgi:hypothetical protein